MYKADIILDSITPNGDRLTTFEITYPRMVHSELMTHRTFSRNSSSSRALPNERLIERIKNDPVFPVWWGKNQSGMQAREEIDDIEGAKEWWLRGRDMMIEWAEEGTARFNLHKQIVNRPLEAWMWITVIVTATRYNNYFKLRCHPDAQPEIQQIAYMMRGLYESQEPTLLKWGYWHLPYIREEEWNLYPLEDLIKLSIARCARVSYLTHDGIRDITKDLGLHDSLAENGHWSPFEHQAKCARDTYPPNGPPSSMLSGNFRSINWIQYRKTIHGEDKEILGSL
ncbi:hypothetical protein LCGC14_2628380 [marine sediment metagenome]|uniref:Uncharacterized protein n=1 Tax=marine sediment metagenome TaxID=412755 RepID=A0A0F9A167_9ZZZZ